MKNVFSTKPSIWLTIWLGIAFLGIFNNGELNASKKSHTELFIHFKVIGRHTHDLIGEVVLPDSSEPLTTHFSDSERGAESVSEGSIKIHAPAPFGLYNLIVRRKDGHAIKHLESCAITVTFPSKEERMFCSKFLPEGSHRVEFCFNYDD